MRTKGYNLSPVLLCTGPVEIMTRVKLLTYIMILMGLVHRSTGPNPSPILKTITNILHIAKNSPNDNFFLSFCPFLSLYGPTINRR
jgi:hypothetical protein